MSIRSILAVLLLALPLARPAPAQCPPLPDGLDGGPACGGAITNVPQHAFGQQALGICWQNCGLAAQANYIAKWSAAVPSTAMTTAGPMPNCGWYQSTLRIYNTSGVMQWGGVVQLMYARTWLESTTAGAANQVWRFLANGDLRPLNSTAMPCGTPACAASTGSRVRFTGYVDYTYDCVSGIPEEAWMLTHACDAIDHVIGFPRGGVYHPGRNFTFVGPALGFVVGASTGNEAGATGIESMRQWDATALPARCAVEEPLLTATITAGASICMCGTGPANWFQGQLQLGGAFGSVLFPFPGSDPFRSFPIGQWTNPAVFPGVEEVRWNCGEGQWVTCSGLTRQEYYYGVTTIGGPPSYSFNASAPTVVLPLTFVDQCNSVLFPGNNATRNRPFRSDHVFNLNF